MREASRAGVFEDQATADAFADCDPGLPSEANGSGGDLRRG